MFELRHHRQCGEWSSAVGVGADDAFRRDIGDACGETFIGGRLLAESAFECEASAVFEADGVGHLTF